MSYYLWCNNVEVCLRNHETYSSKEDVLATIEENKELIEKHKQTLFGMCCGNPRDLFSGEEGTPIENIQQKFEEIFEDELCGLKYLIAHNVDLQYIADNWDRHEEG